METATLPRSFTQMHEGGGDSRNGRGSQYVNMGASELQRLIQKVKSERASHLDTI